MALNCSHMWIKQYGEKACLDVLATTEIEVVEMDEGHRT